MTVFWNETLKWTNLHFNLTTQNNNIKELFNFSCLLLLSLSYDDDDYYLIVVISLKFVFQASMPCLETIKPIYHDMKKILGTR